MMMSVSASVSGLEKLRLMALSFEIQVEGMDNLLGQQNCGAHCIVIIPNISNYKLSLTKSICILFLVYSNHFNAS